MKMLVTIVVRCMMHILRHRMMRMKLRSNFLDYSIKTIVIICRILDDSNATIGLVDTVRAMNYVTVSYLVLCFYITGVRIVYAIVERVFWMRL